MPSPEVPGAAPATERVPAGPFTGDPAKLLDGGEEDVDTEDGGAAADEGDGDAPPPPPAPKPERFREVHRLAFAVECAW